MRLWTRLGMRVSNEFDEMACAGRVMIDGLPADLPEDLVNQAIAAMTASE